MMLKVPHRMLAISSTANSMISNHSSQTMNRLISLNLYVSFKFCCLFSSKRVISLHRKIGELLVYLRICIS
uniref:Uncharacterized protein n=1 Tax=Parascaris univalens TaxID=6257 RepID=A0A915BID8_PARUN